MRVVLGIVAGVLLLAVAAIVLAPASLVDGLVATRTAGRIRLADASGFWWRGRGVVTSSEAAARLPIAWRVRVVPLATGRVVVQLAGVQPGMPSGTLALAKGDVEARDLQLTIPAALLAAFVPSLAAFAPGGDIDVRATSFAWHAPLAAGRLEANWRDARLAIAGIPVVLGRVLGSASGSGERIGGVFDNSGGEIAIRGTWQMRPEAMEATTMLTATAHTPPALRAILPMLGKADGNGGIEIDWRGRR